MRKLLAFARSIPAHISPAFALCLLLIIGWDLLCRYENIPTYIVPKPSDIAFVLISDAPTLFIALLSTLSVTIEAFAFAVLTGTLLAILIVQNRFLENVIFPFAVLLQVTPIVAIAPLIIILVHNTQLAILICATLMALFPIISNTVTGLRSIDTGLSDYFKLNRAGRFQILWRLKIPSALPFFLAGLRISSGLALIGAIVAEFIAGSGGRSAGLAYEILQAGYALDIPRMFAALVLIGLSGFLIFRSMGTLTHRAIGHWHDSEINFRNVK